MYPKRASALVGGFFSRAAVSNAAIRHYSTPLTGNSRPSTKGLKKVVRAKHPIETLVDRLHYTIEEDTMHRPHTDIFSLPSTKRVIEIVTLLRKIMFPGIFEDYHVSNENIKYHLGMHRVAIRLSRPRTMGNRGLPIVREAANGAHIGTFAWILGLPIPCLCVYWMVLSSPGGLEFNRRRKPIRLARTVSKAFAFVRPNTSFVVPTT